MRGEDNLLLYPVLMEINANNNKEAHAISHGHLCYCPHFLLLTLSWDRDTLY